MRHLKGIFDLYVIPKTEQGEGYAVLFIGLILAILIHFLL